MFLQKAEVTVKNSQDNGEEGTTVKFTDRRSASR